MPAAAPARVLMVQGTTSDAGKSTLTAALCRVFAQAGYRVAPFKAQNMSNNAAVVDGGEIGRAQAVQAMAAGVEPTVDMNPVLLKPQGDRTSQLVVLGRAQRAHDAVGYYARKVELWPVVTAALDRLRAAHDVVIIEGAGSPAEINLAQYDIVNMRVARHAGAPVLLVGDIERGGVFAALYGTVALLTPEERALVRGFVINKFRGDPSLLTPGFAMLEERTGIPTLGVLPYLDLSRVPAEDGLALDAAGRLAGIAHDDDGEPPAVDVAVLRLPRIANLDEFQPLAAEPGVRVRFVRTPDAMGAPDLVVVPGTKATRADLAWMRARGLDAAVRRAHAAGARVLGVCGGYQMLGLRVDDPLGVEGDAGGDDGLGLLPVVTEFAADKVTVRVHARAGSGDPLGACAGTALAAYEIHMGRTRPAGPLGPPPFAVGDDGMPDGATSTDGTVVGTYLHGLFENAAFRRAVVASAAARRGVSLPPMAADDAGHRTHDDAVAHAFDALADAVRAHLDLAAVTAILGLPPLPTAAAAHA
ncbi:MAG TPA: cobyric acid synthase [Gemmatirosa sp.]